MKIGIAALTFALLTLHAESAKCVVTYTFDDGLADQYTLAYPMFRKAGLPADEFARQRRGVGLYSTKS